MNLDNILTTALITHLQKICYDTKSDEIIITYMLKTLNLPTTGNLDSDIKRLLSRLSENKTLKIFFHY